MQYCTFAEITRYDLWQKYLSSLAVLSKDRHHGSSIKLTSSLCLDKAVVQDYQVECAFFKRQGCDFPLPLDMSVSGRRDIAKTCPSLAIHFYHSYLSGWFTLWHLAGLFRPRSPRHTTKTFSTTSSKTSQNSCKKIELPPACECLGGAIEKILNIPVNGDCFWQRLRKFSVYHQF